MARARNALSESLKPKYRENERRWSNEEEDGRVDASRKRPLGRVAYVIAYGFVLLWYAL
jgi:hypothetical protein